jgi:hypothetical protein
METLGLIGDLWLCRGAVRCALLGEIQTWDDFDVMTEMPLDALDAAIENSNLVHSRTFYGGYSLKLPSGRKVDLWSFTWTCRQRCASLAEALSLFEFNVDAIAWSLRNNTICDPRGVKEEILGRQLRVQTKDRVQNKYMPWKAAYLVLRHDLRPCDSVVRLWDQTPTTDGLPEKAVRGLQEELKMLHIHKALNRVRRLSEEYPSFAGYVDLLI